MGDERYCINCVSQNKPFRLCFGAEMCERPQGPLKSAAPWATIRRVTRLRRIADRDRIFFVTTNLRPHSPALTSGERDLVLKQLARQHANDEFLLFAYVIMPSHAHLLIAPKAAGLISVMREFKSCTGMVLAKARCSRRPIWQPRYFDFVLRRVGDFWDKLEYIHENPVEAGLAEKPESWVWSSAAYYARAVPFPISMDSIDLPVDRRAWLRATP
jgi:REP element-mobilizing transposase RayT